MLQFKIR